MADTKKKLNDLRVIDLRLELENRGLDKSGVRAILLKRLTKAIKDEGHDPETFTIAISGTEPKTPSKRSSRSESVIEGEEDPPMDVSVDDMVVQDEVAEEDETELEPKETLEKEEKSKQEVSFVTVEEVSDSPKKASKRENIEETEATDAKRVCKDEVDENVLLEENGVENSENTGEVEDSINLDIGEDELLNDETEAGAKTKRDEGSDNTTAPQAGDTAPDVGAAPEVSPSDAADDTSAEDKEEKTNIEVSKNTSESQDLQNDNSDKKDDKDETRESVEGKPQDNSGQGSGSARNLWVSGLSGNTRAKDLKQLCSKHGKVIGAKVVTNARTPGSRCYGYVTLASSADAESCIKNLHRTELHGRMISVEKAKSDAAAAVAGSGSSRRPTTSSSRSYRPHQRRDGDKDESSVKEKAEGESEVKSEVKQDGENGLAGAAEVAGEGAAEGTKEGEGASEEKVTDSAKKEVKKEGTTKSHTSTEKRRHSNDRHDKARYDKRVGHRSSPRDVLSFSKIMKERDLQRVRERGRNHREEERRRREAEEALRERERRQRQEKQRLQIEREKLRIERERIEREKNDLLRLERERHKLEREKLELERLELKREQQRLEAVRGRTLKGTHSGYEGSNSAYDRNARDRKPALAPLPAYERDSHRHKRPLTNPQTSSSAGRGYDMRTPSPPRFNADSSAYDNKDYASASRHLSTASGMKYSANGTSSDSRQPLPPGTRPKDQGRRYGLAEGDSSARRSRERPAYRDSRVTSPPSKATTWQAAPSRYDMPPQSTVKDYVERVSGGHWRSKGSYTSTRQPASAGGAPVQWTGGAGSSATGGSYDTRYPTVYQPPPPGAAPYAQDSRYAPASRDYQPKY